MIVILATRLTLLALEAHLTVIFIEQSLLNRLFEFFDRAANAISFVLINSAGTQ